MRGLLVVGALAGVVLSVGCTSSSSRDADDRRAGPSPGGASPGAVGPGGSPSGPADASAPSGGSRIRGVDWRNVTIGSLEFCRESDSAVVFRDGSNGHDIPCVMLPGGAQPAYGEFINEEPANRPATEDALVLVELGNPGAARRQALVPIQLDVDGTSLSAWPEILGDEPSPAGDKVMTFTSYRIERHATVVATVRRLDGGTETRRYIHANGSGSWRRL